MISRWIHVIDCIAIHKTIQNNVEQILSIIHSSNADQTPTQTYLTDLLAFSLKILDPFCGEFPVLKICGVYDNLIPKKGRINPIPLTTIIETNLFTNKEKFNVNNNH